MYQGHRSICTRSVATENYTRAIAVLREHDTVTNARLAAHLRVTPAAVTEMLQRLACHALVVYTPYHGVTLTEQGDQVAMSMLRRYRLLTVFLVKALDCPWDEVCAEADALEHVLSDRLAARIEVHLGHPASDVYGNPIPRLDGSIKDQPHRRLADVTPGGYAIVLRVPDRDPRLLRYFWVRLASYRRRTCRRCCSSRPCCLRRSVASCHGHSCDGRHGNPRRQRLHRVLSRNEPPQCCFSTAEMEVEQLCDVGLCTTCARRWEAGH